MRLGMSIPTVLILVGAALAVDPSGLTKNAFEYVRYYRPIMCSLADEPEETLAAEPAYTGTARYGALHLGNGPDPVITLVLDEDIEGEGDARVVTDSRLHLDLNNDEDLTNDETGWSGNDEQTFDKDATVTIQYDTDGQTIEVQYPIALYRFKQRSPDALFFFRDCVVRTTVNIGGKDVQVVLVDDDTDGLYDDINAEPDEQGRAQGAFLVDRDLNGALGTSSDSAEYYEGSEPFELGGRTYKLARVSATGDSVTFAETDEPCEPKLYIEAGHPAPDFELTDTEGKALKLSDYRGNVVLIDFWASWCGPCKDEMPNVIADYEKYRPKGFEIIGISLDRALAPMNDYLKGNAGITWRMVCSEKSWDDPTAAQYRVSGIPAAFLINKDGIIHGQVRGESLTEGLKELLGE